MAFNYGKMTATAKRLIKKFGKPAVLVKEANEVFDPITGFKTSTEVLHNFIGVFAPVSSDKIKDLDLRMKAQGLVYKQYKFLTVDGAQIYPVVFAPTDKIRLDGLDWNIAGITIVDPGIEKPVVWKIAIGI
jgi:hypothetical protein